MMYVPRFWRMQASRYRLEGVRYTDGTASVQQRPVQDTNSTESTTYEVGEQVESKPEKMSAA